MGKSTALSRSAMRYTVLIPARLQSTRLQEKALADIGGVPMVVRVARQAALSNATQVVVATDSLRIQEAAAHHGVTTVMTHPDHSSGSDRLAEASILLDLPEDEIVVNVQGDEPLIDPILIDAVARQLQTDPSASMSTAAHEIIELDDWCNPNVVKVVLDANDRAMIFSRSPIPWPRDIGEGAFPPIHLPTPAPLRHIGIYGYRVGFLRRFSRMASSWLENTEALEQLRALWHGYAITVHRAKQAPAGGVDTQQDLDRVRALLA